MCLWAKFKHFVLTLKQGFMTPFNICGMDAIYCQFDNSQNSTEKFRFPIALLVLKSSTWHSYYLQEKQAVLCVIDFHDKKQADWYAKETQKQNIFMVQLEIPTPGTFPIFRDRIFCFPGFPYFLSGSMKRKGLIIYIKKIVAQFAFHIILTKDLR